MHRKEDGHLKIIQSKLLCKEKEYMPVLLTPRASPEMKHIISNTQQHKKFLLVGYSFISPKKFPL